MTASQLASAVRLLFGAQVVIVGAAGALIVTVKLQLWPLPVQVTGVDPAGKVEPDAGSQVTFPQSPVLVGGG